LVAEVESDPKLNASVISISSFGVGTIVRDSETMTSERYVQILEDNLIKGHPFLLGKNSMRSKYSFMQDNAGPHRGNIVAKFFTNLKVTKLDWPAYSPDINPIENVWGYIKGRLYECNNDLEN
jgi:hypothetical protein